MFAFVPTRRSARQIQLSQRLRDVQTCCQSGCFAPPVSMWDGAGVRDPSNPGHRFRFKPACGYECQLRSCGNGDELLQPRRRWKLWSRMCQPSGIPSFARSLLRGLSGALRRLALLLRLPRPTGYGFPSGASVNAELRHLGAGPSSLFSDPSKIGKFNQTETPSCTRTK